MRRYASTNCLAKLAKPACYSSVDFRHTTPGSVAPLAFHFLRSVRPLDPAHPSAKLQKHTFPIFNHSLFSIRAFPLHALESPLNQVEELTTLKACLRRADKVRNPGERSPPRRFPMSVQFVIKKNVTKSSFIRRALPTAIKSAISLIIVRGATAAKQGKDQWKLDFDEAKAHLQQSIVIPGWTYVFVIPLAVRPPPIPELVEVLNRGFKHMQGPILKHEESWKQMKKVPLSKPKDAKPQIEHSALLFDDDAPLPQATPPTVPSLFADLDLSPRGIRHSEDLWFDSVNLPPEVSTSIDSLPVSSARPSPKSSRKKRRPDAAPLSKEPTDVSSDSASSSPASISSIRNSLFRHSSALTPPLKPKPSRKR